ncbi:MAG TPA: 4'-phosphopantetheinyl transferase superfamily protein [Solirubrobacteraceae bacterium]|nr:4'-phosphopantetheinyl transferase superfamily protein [Solirubrobacteraceae bacterium]
MKPSTATPAFTAWAPGPRSPELGEGVVHVWRADLERVDGQLEGLLCEQERARAARLLGERRRRLWMRSRGVLRTLLGRYLRADPRALRITVDSRGKPAAGLPFNLAHSGELALYAFCAEAPVGVDVEGERPTFDEVAIAARVLGAQEATRLREIADGPTRHREFLRAWTRYEAELKCLGTGIGGVTDAGVWVAQLEPGMGAAGAVACTRAPRELCCWSWPARAATAG